MDLTQTTEYVISKIKEEGSDLIFIECHVGLFCDKNKSYENIIRKKIIVNIYISQIIIN